MARDAPPGQRRLDRAPRWRQVGQLGLDVALVGPGATPPTAVLRTAVGAAYRDLHAEHDVELHLGESVEAFLG